MAYRLRADAERVIALAVGMACALGEEVVEDDHLLYAVLEDRENAASAVLTSLDRIGALRAAVLASVGAGTIESALASTTVARHAPLGAGAKRVLKAAHQAALALRRDRIGAEHLLLGLIDSGEETVARVFAGAGLDAGTVFGAVAAESDRCRDGEREAARVRTVVELLCAAVGGLVAMVAPTLVGRSRTRSSDSLTGWIAESVEALGWTSVGLLAITALVAGSLYRASPVWIGPTMIAPVLVCSIADASSRGGHNLAGLEWLLYGALVVLCLTSAFVGRVLRGIWLLMARG